MARVEVVRIRPGESDEEFGRRVAETAPHPSTDVVEFIRDLLRPGIQPQPVARTAPRADKLRAA